MDSDACKMVKFQTKGFALDIPRILGSHGERFCEPWAFLAGGASPRLALLSVATRVIFEIPSRNCERTPKALWAFQFTD